MNLDIGFVMETTAAFLAVVIYFLVDKYYIKTEQLPWMIIVISLMLVLDIIRGVLLGHILAWPQAIFWTVALVVYLRYLKKIKN